MNDSCPCQCIVSIKQDEFIPGNAISARPSHQPFTPDPSHFEIEVPHHLIVARDPVVGIVSLKFLIQRLMLPFDGMVSIDPAPLRNFLERSREPALLGLPLDHRHTFTGLCPVVGES